MAQHMIRVAIGAKPRESSFREFNARASFVMQVDDAEMAALKRVANKIDQHSRPGMGLLQIVEMETVEA